MQLLTPTEEKMWEKTPSLNHITMSDQEINDKYEKGEQRILTEMNREKLPAFVDALKKPGYMDIQPFYQRRKRWDQGKKSRLIESFLSWMVNRELRLLRNSMTTILN